MELRDHARELEQQVKAGKARLQRRALDEQALVVRRRRAEWRQPDRDRG